MRLATAAGVALISAANAHGQVQPFPFINQTFKTLMERHVIQAPNVKDPLQPEGFANPAPKYESLPEAGSDNLEFKLEKAGSGGRIGNKVHITDGTEFWFRGYHVFADEADGDLQTQIFTMRGNVVVIGKDATIVGRRVTVNFDNETYLAEDADSQLSPALTKGQVRGETYINAKESHGSEQNIWAHDGAITTCDLPDPHFHLDAEDAEIRPGRRAILRHAKVVVLGHTILNVPYLSIPLDDRSYRYTPQVGQSQDEGYFIKTRYPIPLRGGNNFDSRVDYMTKLGTGLGGDYRYFNKSINGVARIYTITGQSNAFTITNDHRQDFRWGTLTLNNDYERNNYLTAPGSTVLNTRAQLSMPGKNGASTRLSFNRSGSNSGSFETSNETITLSDQRRFGKAQTSLDVSWLDNTTKFQGSPSTDSRRIDLRFRGTEDLNKATANFEYLRTIPVGDTQGLLGSSDKTPFLSLTSDANRLMGRKFADALPFTTELSFGEFGTSNITGTSTDHVGRYNFDFRFNRPDRSDNRLRLDMSGQFRQGMYSDDTAAYTNALNTNLSYKLGRDTSANLRWNYTRQYGFTPLLIDRIGRMNLASFDVSYRPIEPLLIAAQTSYDMIRLEQSNIAWQQFALRTEYTPRENILFRTYSTYDTFQQTWSNVRLDFAYKQGEMFFALGARYDGYQKAWSNANIYLDNLKWGRLKLSAILSYNGFTKQFDTQQYSFIYDLHCAEAIMIFTRTQTGFRPGNDVQFFIRLKALPFDLPFGFGTRGQPLGTPSGFGY